MRGREGERGRVIYMKKRLMEEEVHAGGKTHKTSQECKCKHLVALFVKLWVWHSVQLPTPSAGVVAASKKGGAHWSKSFHNISPPVCIFLAHIQTVLACRFTIIAAH